MGSFNRYPKISKNPIPPPHIPHFALINEISF